jgi:copper chaperone
MTTLSVPDMSCGHCKASVTQALTSVKGTSAIEVDLTTRQVQITSDAPEAALLAALNEVGFPATVISAK